jgi:hypothetical protein
MACPRTQLVTSRGLNATDVIIVRAAAAAKERRSFQWRVPEALEPNQTLQPAQLDLPSFLL